MPWRPLPRIAFAICIYPFQPSSPADLPLEIGDELYIIEQGGADGAWYRGYLVAPPSLLAGLTSVKGQTLEARVFSGIFPRCCVEVREVLGEDRTRGRAETPAYRRPDSLSRAGTHSSHGELPNGLMTPSESASGTSAIVKAPRGVGRLELASPVGSLLRSKSDSQDVRSFPDGTPAHLPLSPVSVGPRDPDAPKPPAPVPMLKIGDETPTSAQEPLVDEIGSCLREWHATKLHELLLARRYGSLDKMSDLVQRLDMARRQLLHHVLTKQELAALREATVWDLVRGNKILSGEVIVRSPSDRGRILTADDSAVETTRLQSMMSLLDKRPTHPLDEHNLHHVLVQMKSALDPVKRGSSVTVYLCLKLPGNPAKPLTETFAIDTFSQENGGVQNAEDHMRTFFTDLSSIDIGEGVGSGSKLYLVFKVTAYEPLRSTTSGTTFAQGRDSTSSPKAPGINGANLGSMRTSGRRSLMWSQRSRKDADGAPKRSEHPERPRTGDSNHKLADGRPHSSGTSKAKRPVGMGVFRLDPLMRARENTEQEITIWAPSLSSTEEQEVGSFDEVVTELFPSTTGNYQKCASLRCVKAEIHAFEGPDSEALIKKTPTLLHNVVQTRKIGFSGAPTKPRSDIYLTLSQPFLPRNALLSHPKSGTVPLAAESSMGNLQLTLEVRRSNGDRIENCIHPSGNSAGHTAWRTPAIERGQAWNLTFRLAISPEDVPGSHIVMSIADTPEFPFALCWMPLWVQEAFIRDGDHSLALYKYDEYTSSVISGKHAYMALPWSSRRKDESVVGPMAGLHMRTYLCSTKYSQDPYLLGLLKWREQPDPGEVTGLLKRFVFVPEIEIVKLLNETFDALFEILVEYSGNDEHEDLVFNALVIVLGIVHDRRFKLGPLVDQYADTRFKYPFVTSSLTRSFIRLLASPTDSDASRRLRATFKVGRHVFKFIMRARQQQKEKEAEIGITSGQESFMKNLKTIFKSLEALMANSAPVLIGTQTLLVQNFHAWLPELSLSMKPQDVLHVASSFVDSCSSVQGKLILYKLVLIIHFADMAEFKLAETRRALLTNTVRWLAPHWGDTDLVTSQWKDQVRLCCSVVASQVEDLGEEVSEYLPKLVRSYRAIQHTGRQGKGSLSLLFPTSYPFPSRPTTSDSVFDESLVELSALLAATSNLPTCIHLDMAEPELADFLFNTLQVYLSILDCEAFPSSWLSTHIYHHRATMKALEKLSNILVESFLPHPDEADSFNTELWRAFFDTLLKLVGSDALALETFPEQKRRAVWKIAGDVRELGADLLRRSWEVIGWETSAEDKKQFGLEKMGGYQVQYVPGLVAPIVELCLSVHEGLRCVAIEVLQTMIVSEWTLSQDLGIIQAEMIDCLDRLFKSKQLTESILQKLFISELLSLFEPLAQEDDSEGSLYSAVRSLITIIDELLDLLVAVHSTEASGEAFHLMDTLHLMEFLRDMQKEDIYIRYVHQLARIQADARNFTEAGLALRLHAELYHWDPCAIVEALGEPELPAQSSFERKETLFFQMIKHYEEGQSWENALGAYIELGEQYEHNTFDFAKLARTQRAMATIYESLSKGERQNPRFFRVVYKGLGFPVALRDKQFIFEGSPMDRMSTFTDKMQQLHPAAQVLSAGVEEELEGQYLQMSPVSPQRDLHHPILQRAKVASSVRDYYLLSRPKHFTVTSRRLTSDMGIREQTVEKTVFTTRETFPTVLRRSEIVEIGTVTLTPVQTAIERVTRKTAEALAIEKRATEGDDSAWTALTEALISSVDPASETSVALYRDLLPPPPSMDDDMVDEPPAFDPLDNALQIALMDHALAIKRCLAAYSRPAHQATKADLTQRFESTFAAEVESLAPPPSGLMGSAMGSWLPRTASPHAPSPLSNHGPAAPSNPTPPSPVPDGRGARHEKNRLSLTFLKRGSHVEQRDARKQAAGATNGTVKIANDTDKTSSRSGGKDQKSRGHAYPSVSSNDTTSQRGSSRRSLSSDRKPEAARGDAFGAAIGERVGSMKKRLSLLNIGRKGSKMSFKGRVDESLVEEE